MTTCITYPLPLKSVNLETDIAGRYIRHFMTLDKAPESATATNNEAKQESKSFSKDWLMSKGFI